MNKRVIIKWLCIMIAAVMMIIHGGRYAFASTMADKVQEAMNGSAEESEEESGEESEPEENAEESSGEEAASDEEESAPVEDAEYEDIPLSERDAYAEDESFQNMVEEIGDERSDERKAQEQAEAEAAAAEEAAAEQEIDLSTPEKIVEAIENADEDTDKVVLQKIRDAYDALPTSDKININNIDKLNKLLPEESEETGEEEAENTNSATRDTVLTGTEYTFEITQTKKALSIVIRFTSDDDGDGRSDIPQVTITSPKGKLYELSTKDGRFDRDNIVIDTTNAGEFMQLDIPRAEEGVWTIKTSTKVTFERIEYQGAASELVAEDDPADTALPEEEEEPQNPYRIYMMLGIFAFFVLLAVLVVALLRPKKKKEDIVAIKQKSEEEQLKEIYKEFAQQKELYERMDRENAEKATLREEQAEQTSRKEEKYYVTQKDIDSDESIQEFMDEFDTGILQMVNDSEEEEEDIFEWANE